MRKVTSNCKNKTLKQGLFGGHFNFSGHSDRWERISEKICVGTERPKQWRSWKGLGRSGDLCTYSGHKINIMDFGQIIRFLSGPKSSSSGVVRRAELGGFVRPDVYKEGALERQKLQTKRVRNTILDKCGDKLCAIPMLRRIRELVDPQFRL